MIYFLTTSKHQYTINAFLDDWAPELKNMVFIKSYDEIFNQKSFNSGSYFFTDIERLTPHMVILAEELWDKLHNNTSIRLYNHPTKSMRRYELLKMLYDFSENSFRVFRISDSKKGLKFPVFIRGENDHYGSLSGLIYNHKELNLALKKAVKKIRKLSEILIVEFLDTSDTSGVYRKYSSFILGEKVIPRHILYSNKWMVKYPDIERVDDDYTEEAFYLEMNPHENKLKSVFKKAGIEYGRIDYSLLNGKLQVWEINTNPIVLRPMKEYKEDYQTLQWVFENQFKNTLLEINRMIINKNDININIKPTTYLKSKIVKYNDKFNQKMYRLIPNEFKPFLLKSLR